MLKTCLCIAALLAWPTTQAQSPNPVPTPNTSTKAANVLRRTPAPALYELAYSPNQQALFVASAGGTGENASLTRVLRLDPHNLDLLTEIPLKERGFGMALDDENNRLFVSNALDAGVTVIDTQTNEVVTVIRVAEPVAMTGFQGEAIERPPHNLRELVLDRSNQRLFAPGLWIQDSALYVINTGTMALEKVIPGLGYGASGVTLDVQGGKLYVSNLQGQLFQINARSLELEKTLEVEADQLLNLAFDNKRQRVLAVDQGAPYIEVVRETVAKVAYQSRGSGNRIVVIDPGSGAVEKSIPTGDGPVNLLLDEARDLLYVTNRGAGTVTVFDRSANDQLVHSWDLPKHPNSLALDRQSGAVFATIKGPHQDAIRAGESVARLEWAHSD